MGPHGAETDPIPISAVQHAVYCLRQAALIHLERLWSENRLTEEGDVLHAIADKGGKRHARGVRRVMSLPLSSARLNLQGVADLVEFSPAPNGEQAFLVEYKRGKPKLHRADEVQLCAQGLCLEEMTGQSVFSGALYYAETHRRVQVPFDDALRELTETTVAALAHVLLSRQTPPPTPSKARCRGCSLQELCRPESFARPVKLWRDQMLSQTLGAL